MATFTVIYKHFSKLKDPSTGKKTCFTFSSLQTTPQGELLTEQVDAVTSEKISEESVANFAKKFNVSIDEIVVSKFVSVTGKKTRKMTAYLKPSDFAREEF